MPTRRGFLGSALAAAAAGAAESPGDLKLGVASYSLRKFPRRQAIEMIQQTGTRYVSVKEFHLLYKSTPPELEAGRREFHDAGLVILSGGNISLQNPSELRGMFEYAKGAGMPLIVCAPTPATLPAVEKLVKEYNIRAAIHNHGPEDRHFPTPQSVLKAIDGMDPRVGLCIDIGHTARTGVDVVESIRLAGARLLDMHVKDLRELRNGAAQCAVGEGAMPMAAIFRELKRMNYQGGVMLEYEINADNPLAGMIKSMAFMSGVLAGLRG